MTKWCRSPAASAASRSVPQPGDIVAPSHRRIVASSDRRTLGSSTFTTVVLFLTLGFTLWGGFVMGPRRIVPALLLLGPLFLPAFALVNLPGVPPLDRLTAVTAPALLLFFFSSRECWRRFRFTWPDVLLLTYVVWTIICVTVNQGGYAATSMAISQVLTIAVPYFAGRLYLQRVHDVLHLVRLIVPFVLVYFVLMAFEARMYPRFQSWVYGEDVTGLYRLGIYRPIVFAQNQLELGHMMVLLTLLMVGVHRAGGKIRKHAGRHLEIAILAGCVGVLMSLSRGPIITLGMVLLVPVFFKRQGLLACALGVSGVAFFAWMLRPGVSSILAGLAMVDADSEAGQTLFFRFLQIESWKPLVEQSPIFGYGESWARPEYEIIDGELLLTVLGYGYPGVALLSMFWLSIAWVIGQRTFPRKHLFQHVGAAMAPVLGWMIFSAWGDSFMRAPHYLVVGGLLGVLAGVRREAEEDSLASNPIRTVAFRYG